MWAAEALPPIAVEASVRKPWTPTVEVVDATVTRIVERFNPISVIVFGSLARGDAGPESDVDVLVVLEDGVDALERMKDLCVALSGLGVSKDVVVTTPERLTAERGLRASVVPRALSEGLVIYERG